MGNVISGGIIQARAAAGTQELEGRGLIAHADEYGLFDVRLFLAAHAKLWKPVTVRLVNVRLCEVYTHSQLVRPQ
jgi:hypothetical protein